MQSWQCRPHWFVKAFAERLALGICHVLFPALVVVVVVVAAVRSLECGCVVCFSSVHGIEIHSILLVRVVAKKGGGVVDFAGVDRIPRSVMAGNRAANRLNVYTERFGNFRDLRNLITVLILRHFRCVLVMQVFFFFFFVVVSNHVLFLRISELCIDAFTVLPIFWVDCLAGGNPFKVLRFASNSRGLSAVPITLRRRVNGQRHSRHVVQGCSRRWEYIVHVVVVVVVVVVGFDLWCFPGFATS